MHRHGFRPLIQWGVSNQSCYRHSCPHCTPVNVVFTGVIHLIAPETRLQLWCGMLGSLLTFILYLQARPFKHAIVDNVQAAALLQILFTYISAFLFFSDGGEEFHDEV